MRLAYPLNAFPHQAKTITQPGRFVKKSYQWWIKVLRVLKVGPAFCTRKTNYPIQISKATVLFNEVKIKSFDTELSNKSTYLMTKINSFTESVIWKKKSRKYCRTLRYKMKSSPVFYALK